MKIFTTISNLLIVSALLLPTSLFAQGVTDVRSNYQNYIEVTPAASAIPTVVEVPLPQNAEEVLVYEVQSGSYLASFIDRRTVTLGTNYTFSVNVSPEGVAGPVTNLNDSLRQTYVDLVVSGTRDESSTDFIVSADQFSAISQVAIDYAQNSALPLEVALYVETPNGEELIKRSMGSAVRNLVFPERYGRNWRLAFSYNQPVRVEEISFGPVRVSNVVDTVSFLAQPGEMYHVYLYPESGQVGLPTLRASGDLRSGTRVAPAAVGLVQPNPTFSRGDLDNDGVPDITDNCPNDYNPDQRSTRNGLKGDVCDDFDNDGVVNTLDNCEFIPNYNQRDTDGDGIGDECDKEESRLTEQYPWLPWLGMGITFIVIVVLFISVARQPLPSRMVKEDKVEDEEIV